MLTRIAVIIITGFIAYGCMLKAPFKTRDDRISIIENPMIKSFKNLPAIFKEGYFHDQYYYRPLVNLSFMGEYRAFGLKPFFYNLDNLIIHILNAVLVFVLVSRLTNNVSIGFWTGLLFVMHPVQWEAVCNISGRAILMSAFFELSTFVLFLKFYAGQRWVYLLLAMITFPLGLLCKESAGVLPAVLFIYLCLDKGKTWIRKVIFMVPFLIGIAGYFLLRDFVGINKVFHPDNPIELILGFVTFLRSVITDLRLFILPVDLHFDRCLPFFMSLTSPSALLAMVLWAAVLTVLFVWRRKISAFVFFLIFWFALELLPVSQLITGIGTGAGYVSTAEHFLYVACIPVFIGMVMTFRSCYELNEKHQFLRPYFLKFLAGGFLAFLLLIAVEQSIYASNEYSMLERSLSFDPNNPRIQSAMGLLSVSRNDIPDAQVHFRAAAKADPTNPVYHISLGMALCQLGRWIEGLEQLVLQEPGNDKARVEQMENQAMAHIRQELGEGKNFDDRGWLAIGIYYARMGQNSPAIDAFFRSVRSNPGQADAWFNLGSLYEAQRNWPAARVAYKRLLSLSDSKLFQKDFALKQLSEMEGR